MSTQTAPVAPESVEPGNGSWVGFIVLLVLLVVVSAGVFVAYRASRTTPASTYTAAQLHALDNLALPSQFDRVDSTWACVSNEQSVCFNSRLDSQAAVEALAKAMGEREYTTSNVGSSPFGPTRHFCTTVGSAPALVVVDARPTNAVLKGQVWIVPPRQQPKIGGSAVNVYLTGPSTCP